MYPGITRSLCFGLQIAAPSVSWAASLCLSLWIPGQGLTRYTGHWLSEGVSSPSSKSLKDFIFCRLLHGPFLEFPADDGLGRLDPKDSSRKGVDEFLIFFSVTAALLYVSAPYSRTGFTVALKILSLMLMARLGETQTSSFGERLLSLSLHLEKGCLFSLLHCHQSLFVKNAT